MKSVTDKRRISFEEEVVTLLSAKTLDELRHIRNLMFANHGFSMFYYVTPVTFDRRFGRIMAAVNMPAEWERAYRDRLYLDDPMPCTGLRERRPMRWSEIEASCREQGKDTSYFDSIRMMGLGDGVALPAFGPGCRNGFVGLVLPKDMLTIDDDAMMLLYASEQLSFVHYCNLIDREHSSSEQLTPRELDVIYWISLGKSNSAIAGILDISEETVDSYVRRIFTKLGVSSCTSAVLNATLQGHLFSGFYRAPGLSIRVDFEDVIADY